MKTFRAGPAALPTAAWQGADVTPAHRQGCAREKSPNSPRALPLLPGTARPAAASQPFPRRRCLYFPLPALQEAAAAGMGAAPLPGLLGFVGSRLVGIVPWPGRISQLALPRIVVTRLRTQRRSPWRGDSVLFLLPEPPRRFGLVADLCPQAVMPYFCSWRVYGVPLVLSFPSP